MLGARRQVCRPRFSILHASHQHHPNHMPPRQTHAGVPTLAAAGTSLSSAGSAVGSGWFSGGSAERMASRVSCSSSASVRSSRCTCTKRKRGKLRGAKRGVEQARHATLETRQRGCQPARAAPAGGCARADSRRWAGSAAPPRAGRFRMCRRPRWGRWALPPSSPS